MRMIHYFWKSVKETLRDWKVLLLTLLLAPFFVLMFYSFLGTQQQAYKGAVLNLDRPVSGAGERELSAADSILESMKSIVLPDGRAAVSLTPILRLEEGISRLETRQSDFLLVFPEDFSQALAEAEINGAESSRYILYGDPGRQQYMLSAIFVAVQIESWTQMVTGITGPVRMEEHFIGNAIHRSDFELSVPGAFIFAMVMVIFTASTSIMKEVDRNTIIRLRLSFLRSGEFLGGITMTQLLVNLAAVALTFLTALALGFRSNGSLSAATAVASLTCLSMLSVSFILCAFSRSSSDILVLGNIPFFLLIFFSGAAFPLPMIELFSAGGRIFMLNDILPTSPALTALQKILNDGAAIAEILPDLFLLAGETVLYGTLGLWLFRRKHM